MAKEKKLNIFDVLGKLDIGDKNYYCSLSDDEKKELSIWVLTRWMSSSKSYSEHHMLMVNDLVNDHSSTLSKHPDLQWKLLCLCGTGRKVRHQWIPPGKRTKKNRKQEIIHDMYPHLKMDEIELFEQLTTEDEFVTLLTQYGLEDKEIKDILK